MSDDSADRAKARFELGVNAVVEAGAGTGKTTLLTDRILYTLLAGGPKKAGVPIERLVALTFTNKAAGEIKQRLSSRLSDLLVYKTLTDKKRRAEAEERLQDAKKQFGRGEEQVQAAAQTAISGMDRALIGTIHHFAAQVLKRYPLEAGVDPGFQVDMGEGFDDLFETEWSRWLSDELGEKAPREAAWLEVLRLAALEDLSRLARDLCRDKVRFEHVGLSREMADRARRIVDGFAPLTRITTPPGGNSKIREHIAELAPRMADIALALGKPLPIPAERENILSKAKTWPKTWAAVSGQAEYERCCELAVATSGLQESLVAKSVALVLPFAKRFRDLYRRRGLVSNDGLILGVWALVLDEPGVREDLKSSYDAFLIDEFQDTDPIQGEMLLLLAEKKGRCADSWRKVEFAPGKLFIVGDPKQSIYRFRGADMRAYDDFKGLLVKQGAQTCRLRRSFRSHEGIVAPVNAIFSQLMKGESGLQPDYADIIPNAKGDEAPRTKLVLFHDSKAEKKLSADAAREAEAAWLAGWIEAQHSPERPYKDMALLLRKTSSLEIYLQALKDKGIPYAVEADKYFYGAQEILDFTNLLRVLDDGDDRAATVGLMRSPLLGLTDQEIYDLARAKCLSLDKVPPSSAGLSARSLGLLSDFSKMTARLRQFAGREPLDEFVSRVLGETFLLELCAAAYHHEQTAANLGKYRRLARQANESRGATLKEFISEVVRSMGDDSLKEGESPLADEQFDAVRILSIHKAKGLEYGTVFVADMGGQTSRSMKASCRVDWGTQQAGLRLEKSKAADLSMAFIEQGEKEREEAEALRLLYVAMTRAKNELYLLGSAAPGSSASFSEFLSRVGGWPDKEQAKTIADFEPHEKLGLGFEVHDLAHPPAGSGALVGAVRGVVKLDGKALGAAWSGRFEEGKRLGASHVFTSPTAYLKEAPKTALVEEFAASRRVPGGRSREEATLVGEVCHRVLERWDFKKPGSLPDSVKSARASLERRHPGADWGGIVVDAGAVLKKFFGTATYRELAQCEIIGREVPFVFPHAGKVVRGSIDLLCRQGGKLWVVDYKTDARRKKTSRASPYRRQGAAYVEAVRKAMGEEAGFKLIHLRDGVVEEISVG